MKNKIESIFFSIKKTDASYLLTMLILAAILCFFELGRNSLTLDEVSTFTASANWQSLWRIAWTQDANMWLYFIVNHFWIKFGTSELWLRTLPALFGILTVPVFYMLAKNIHSERVAKIATPLLITSLYFIFYAQMARSYALSLLLVTLSSYFFLKFIKNTSSRIYLFLYTIVTALAIYTYLLVIFAFVTQYIYLLVSPKNIPWKKMILAWAGIFACVIPLLLAPSLRNGHQLDWLQKPPLVHLPFGIVALAGDSVFFTVLSGLIILILLWKKKHVILEKGMERFYLLWLSLWAGFPIVFSFLFSLFIKPIYQPQYFNFCLPAFILLVVIGLEELKQKKLLYNILLITLFIFSILRLVQWYSGSNHYLTQYVVLENKHPDDWRNAAAYVVERGKSTDAVIFYAYYVREPFEYYYHQYNINPLPKSMEISSGPYDLGGGTRIPEPNISLLDSLSQKYSRIWLVLENNSTPVLGKRTQWLEIERELDKYYTVTSDSKDNQIEIKLFERKNNP